MLSLPLIVPHGDFWMPHRQHIPPTDSSSHQNNNQNNVGRRPNAIPTNAHRTLTPLAQLLHDENKLEQRKQNVRRFGAGWLRPPGVGKTYQARMDEEAEKAEQMETARREALMMEMANAHMQNQLVGDPSAGAQPEEAEEEAEEEERDLDDDVPDADAAEEENEDESGVWAEGDTTTGIVQGEGEVTFNEESLLEGSVVDDGEGQVMLQMEHAELVGRLQDQRDLGMDEGEERDLDEDVPEAGSYEHTDTEEEDDSSDGWDEDEARVQGMSNGRSRNTLGVRSDGRARRSLASEDSEILGSSSFVGSSPAMGRGPGRGNAFRDRVMARRGRGV